MRIVDPNAIGSGYLGFCNRIVAITISIGEETLQPAIAKHAIGCLELEIRAGRKLPSWGGLDYGTWWTTVTPEEFDRGSARTDATLTQSRSSLIPDPIASGRWRGTTICLRGQQLQAEGGGYRIGAGRYFNGHWTYNRRTRRDEQQWQVGMDKDFLACAGIGYGEGKHTTHAGSEEGAAKALRRMASQFLKVELRDL